jgi:ribonucleoside-triphosphate reductase
MGVPVSIKRTSVKPSGTISLLTGSTPGVHFPLSRYYIRRIRMTQDQLPKNLNSNLIEEDPDSNTLIVSFPVDCGAGVQTLESVGMWEQLALSAFMQRHWADN